MQEPGAKWLTSMTAARPQNWEGGSWSSPQPSGRMWRGASMWVPVWEPICKRVSRAPSWVRVRVEEKAGRGVPG